MFSDTDSKILDRLTLDQILASLDGRGASTEHRRATLMHQMNAAERDGDLIRRDEFAVALTDPRNFPTPD